MFVVCTLPLPNMASPRRHTGEVLGEQQRQQKHQQQQQLPCYPAMSCRAYLLALCTVEFRCVSKDTTELPTSDTLTHADADAHMRHRKTLEAAKLVEQKPPPEGFHHKVTMQQDPLHSYWHGPQKTV